MKKIITLIIITLILFIIGCNNENKIDSKPKVNVVQINKIGFNDTSLYILYDCDWEKNNIKCDIKTKYLEKENCKEISYDYNVNIFCRYMTTNGFSEKIDYVKIVFDDNCESSTTLRCKITEEVKDNPEVYINVEYKK